MGSLSSKSLECTETDEAGINNTPFADISELKGPLKNGYFIRPSSFGITPIWYRYNIETREWEWTCYYDYKIWMPVSTLVVTLGMYKGEKPAKANQKIIKALRTKIPSKEMIEDISHKYQTPNNFETIDESITLDEGCKFELLFAFKGKHPIIIIFKENNVPDYDDDIVIRIDLVASKDGNVGKVEYNVVRLQQKMWRKFKDYKKEATVYPLNRTIDELKLFCKIYQMNNIYYGKYENNCRKFMCELCDFLGIECEKINSSEDRWYQMNPTAIMNLNMDNDVFSRKLQGMYTDLTLTYNIDLQNQHNRQ